MRIDPLAFTPLADVVCRAGLFLLKNGILTEDGWKTKPDYCFPHQLLLGLKSAVELCADVCDPTGRIPPPSIDPTLADRAEAIATLLEDASMLIPIEINFEQEEAGKRLMGNSESTQSRDERKESERGLPDLKPWAMEAWMAQQAGSTQKNIVVQLRKKYPSFAITQPRVSEQIKLAKLHAEASGLAKIAAKVMPQVANRPPARTLDPTVADSGQRTDGRSKHLRDKARQIAKEE